MQDIYIWFLQGNDRYVIVELFSRTMEVGFNNGPSFRGHTGRPVSAVSEMEASGMSPMGSTSPVSSPSSMSLHHSPHHHHYQQITTITVKTDEKGYGMKVSGDNPVYVQSVKEGKCLFCNI